MMKPLIISTVCAWLIAGSALAGQPVTLKADTVDSDGMITLSDLFDGAGAAGAVKVAAKPGTALILDAVAVQGLARRSGLDWPNAEGIRRIVVRGGAVSAPGTPAAAVVRGNVDVLTYSRNMAAGEVVQPEDLVWGKVAAAPTDTPRDADAVIGLAARRPLRAGAAVSSRDVSAPQVIKSGELITILYQDGGISLSLQGKALASAGVGEAFAVQNTTSKKMLQAVAMGPGQAAVGPAADALRASRRTQVALR